MFCILTNLDALVISDTGKAYTLNVRNGVLAVIKDTLPQKPDMSLTLNSYTYKSIVNGTHKVVDAVRAGKVKFEGNIKDLENFVAMFDPLFVYKKEAKPQ
jgi:alkyl sulfatase BDS1-like metallo-beta-lactamase superfamily hydrolase